MTTSINLYKSDKEIPELDDKISLEELIINHNQLVKRFNFITKALSFSSNFNCYIANVTLKASGDSLGRDTQKIPHFLGVTPKYRIILRQTGNGVITDVNSLWNSTTIGLKNNGSVEVTITVLIARE